MPEPTPPKYDKDHQRVWLDGLVGKLQVIGYHGYLTVKFENGALVYWKKEETGLPPRGPWEARQGLNGKVFSEPLQ